MKIKHIAMYVKDLNTMKRFYEQYFGASANEMYINPKTGLKTYFLRFQTGCELEIMTRPGVAFREPEPPIHSQGYIHIAFGAGSRENVDALTNCLMNDGYKVLSGPRVTGDGFYESSVLDPEGNQIEITE